MWKSRRNESHFSAINLSLNISKVSLDLDFEGLHWQNL